MAAYVSSSLIEQALNNMGYETVENQDGLVLFDKEIDVEHYSILLDLSRSPIHLDDILDQLEEQGVDRPTFLSHFDAAG